MIYVSSSGLKNSKISGAVVDIAKAGIKDIELSGGTEFYPEMFNELEELREQYQLNYRCHNYFPPPKKHFVLNLASNDEAILTQSRAMIQENIELSKKWKSDAYGFHAGFLISPKVDELGKPITKSPLQDKTKALHNFVTELKKLENLEVKIFVENNVFSDFNFKNFQGQNPFLLCTYEDYKEMKAMCPSLNLLVDVAHLKVSCKTLGLNFLDQLEKILPHTQYLHLSDNNALADENLGLSKSTDYLSILKGNIKNKKITLEVYDGLEKINQSLEIVHSLL